MSTVATIYTGHMRGKFMYDGSTSIDDMINSLLEELQRLKEMKDAGVQLASEADDDYAFLMTDDPKAAQRFGFRATETDH